MQFHSTFVPEYVYAEKDGPYTTRGAHPIHLRQSCLDGACGQHCLFMALIALGVVTPHELRTINQEDGRTRLAKVWKAAKEKFFTGAVGAHLEEILYPIRSQVACRTVAPEAHNLRDTVIKELHEGSLVIAGINNRAETLFHWVLILGIKGMMVSDEVAHTKARNRIDHSQYNTAVFVPTEYLVLDPSGDPLPYLPWNVQLDVNAKPGGYQDIEFLYSPREEMAVKVDELVVLTKYAD